MAMKGGRSGIVSVSTANQGQISFHKSAKVGGGNEDTKLELYVKYSVYLSLL
jgi:hypothetical protein